MGIQNELNIVFKVTNQKSLPVSNFHMKGMLDFFFYPSVYNDFIFIKPIAKIIIFSKIQSHMKSNEFSNLIQRELNGFHPGTVLIFIKIL